MMPIVYVTLPYSQCHTPYSICHSLPYSVYPTFQILSLIIWWSQDYFVPLQGTIKSFMNIYYKYLFTLRSSISDSEGIVYSALIYRALENSEFFSPSGNLDITAVRAFIQDDSNGTDSGCIYLPKINQSKLARHIGMKRDAVVKILKRLKEKRLVSDHSIVCSTKLVDGGYIQLPVLPDNIPKERKLTSQQRIFYGFLKDRAVPYGGIIDTWASRLAELFGTTQRNAYYLLSELEKKGYAERLPDNKLKIK